MKKTNFFSNFLKKKLSKIIAKNITYYKITKNTFLRALAIQLFLIATIVTINKHKSS